MFQVFSQSFHYGFCNIMAINFAVNINNYHVQELQNVKLSALCCQWAHRIVEGRVMASRQRKAEYVDAACSQSICGPKPFSEKTTNFLTPSPTVVKLVASEANLTVQHSCSAYSHCHFCSYQATINQLILKNQQFYSKLSRCIVPSTSKTILYVQKETVQEETRAGGFFYI